MWRQTDLFALDAGSYRLMKPLYVAVVVCVAILTVSLTSIESADAAKKKRCGPKGSRTVLVTARLRVTYTDEYDEGRTYGCWRRGRAQLIYEAVCDESTGCDGPPELLARGSVVAYKQRDCLKALGCGTVVGVRDLRRRRKASTDGSFSVAEFALARNGTVIYSGVGEDFYGSATESAFVEALPLGGQPVLFDRGPDIDTSSLAVGRTRAYWMRGGEPRSALIP